MTGGEEGRGKREEGRGKREEGRGWRRHSFEMTKNPLPRETVS